jgi:hypothetical protein
MAYIGKKPEDAFRGLAYYDTFTGDGSTTTFDLSADAPDGGQNDITVVIDNVRQEPGASKSYTLGDDGSGNYRRITFNVAPDSGSEIYAINPGRSTQLNTVSDNAISAAKLQTDAVTTAKIEDSAVTNAKLAGSIANAKLSNSSITINGTSIALGASGEIVAGTDWQAVTVADGSTTLNAEAGKGYFLDTNAGTIDVNLPTSPTRGDTVVIADYGNNFATNRVIVNTGGKLIDSVVGGEPGSSGFTIETNGAVVELVFADDTAGWIIKQNNAPSDLGAESYAAYVTATGGTVSTSGDFKIHTFTGDGCFVVSCGGNTIGSDSVDYLVVAGGGGGRGNYGNEDGWGGGGAGGFRESSGTSSGCYTASPLGACVSGITISVTTYPITVGAGGTAGPTCAPIGGGRGSNSVFSTITSTGGGGGGPTPVGPGGSGAGSLNTGGSGNTPPTSPAQGNPGGNGANTGPSGGGGGGGATGVGQNAFPSGPGIQGGDGGAGATTSISGSPTIYAGGGGGVGYSSGNCAQGTGGSGGGGDGGNSPGTPGVSGTSNTGGGGGAGATKSAAPAPTVATTGGAGGKGIVIIRYKFQN